MRAERAPAATMTAAWPAREILFDDEMSVSERRKSERRYRRAENRDDFAACRYGEMRGRAIVANQKLTAVEQRSRLAEGELAGGIRALTTNFLSDLRA